MKILYLDPILGISGDMTMAAMVDAGVPFGEIEALLKQLPLSMPEMVPVKTRQGVIEGTHINIADSDIHLSPREMVKLIDDLPAVDAIKNDAKAMLDILLEAESKVHGVPKEETHFHELSHVDTIIDILSAAKGINYLGVDEVYAGPVPHGRGTIKTAHGIVSNPAPATVEILKGCRVVFFDLPVELTTPTGAAIVRHYVKDHGKKAPSMTIQAVGYGLGSYQTDKPDALRIFVGDTSAPSSDEEVWVIEVDLDDMEMEYLGASAEKLKAKGALDVLYFPVYMKKGRVGVRLSLSVPDERLHDLVNAVFLETSTFGMRLRKEGRRVLRRDQKTVETKYGPIRVKYGYNDEGTLLKTHLEFEDVKKIAEEKGIPYRILLDDLKKEI
jgi:pyridinium-3,5-bisthiocarboxylic acid mononucleotide nickel chelatase